MADLTPELCQLIEEQQRDALYGDRVASLSLNQQTEADESWLDNLAVYDGTVYLFSRSGDRARRRSGVLGYRARRRMSHRFWSLCQRCGERCSTGSQHCPACDYLKQSEAAAELRKHNYTTYKRYGCRCDICKAAMRQHNREQRQRGPVTHGRSGYFNYGCRCETCSAAGKQWRSRRAA